MTYAKHIVGEQVRPCRIKRRGRKNCRVVWLDSGLEQLVPRPELQECTAEEAGVEENNGEIDEATPEPLPAEQALSGDDVCRRMRSYQVTIQDLAEKLGITQDEVRDARREGIEGTLLVQEWTAAISGGHQEPEVEAEVVEATA